ncbi:hypothetical protein [Pseudomonas entomophila]|uniref:hypothetical protein n=1 Tax=Pseudomonas entomophila TaxID=312306 RepID=UPI001F022066|nr:hypothetical protein [Pseudomonas entomophila]MCG8291471.1 hypothetical protein [Pseudomonas entomophila]
MTISITTSGNNSNFFPLKDTPSSLQSSALKKIANSGNQNTATVSHWNLSDHFFSIAEKKSKNTLPNSCTVPR